MSAVLSVRNYVVVQVLLLSCLVFATGFVQPSRRLENLDKQPQLSRRKLFLSRMVIKKWVSLHNAERSKYYNGSEVRWDSRLARLAQAHAKFMMQNGNCAAEFNENNSEFGENLFWAAYEHGQKPYTLEDAVIHWVNQEKDYDWKQNKCKVAGMCEAFVQVVWKNSIRLGCGEAFCPYKGEFKGVAQFFVCNYHEAADLVSQIPPF